MFFLGIDPDVSCLTAAIVDKSGMLVSIQAFKSRSSGMQSLKEIIPLVGKYLIFDVQQTIKLIAIEGQEISYTVKIGRNPRSMLSLTHCSGAMHGICSMGFPEADIRIPKPAEWKGQVPKEIHQARVLRCLGIEYAKKGGKSPYCVPSLPASFEHNLNPGEWKHGMDSWGLAVWAMEQYKKDHKHEF